MNVKFFNAAVIAVAACLSPSAYGQQLSPFGVYRSPYATDYPVAQPPIPGYGMVYPSYYSSTVEEGILNGYANYNRSMGEYQRYYTEALKNYQQARGMYIQNNYDAYKTHLAAIDRRSEEQR